MKNIGVLAAFIALGAVAGVACSGDNGGATSPGGGTAGTSSAGHSGSGSGGSGGSGGSIDEKASSAGVAGTALGGSGGLGAAGGEGGEGGAPMEQPTFVSSPLAELSLDAETRAAGYTLISSRLTEKPSGGSGSYYKEWFGEVKNGGGATQCFLQVDADFQDATGGSLLKLHTYAYGPTYDLGDGVGLTGTCASPGDTLPLWSNALDATNVNLDNIKKIVVHVEGLERPKAKLHPSTPTLGAVNKTLDPQLKWWTFGGTATSVADIWNVKLEFWGKSGGFIVGKAAAFHDNDFLEGDSWSYSTLAGIDSPTLDSATQYFGFIDGRENALRVVYSGDAAIAAAQRSAANAEHRATEARHEQAR